MTTTNDKLRSVLLAAMLVTSVFAGTVAFAGAATAQAANEQVDQGPVEYTDGTSNLIEVVFEGSTDELTFTVHDREGNLVTTATDSGPKATINLGTQDLSGDATLYVDNGDSNTSYSITTTATTISNGTDVNAYSGEQIAVDAGADNVDYELKVDGRTTRSFSTGVNSEVAVLNTEGLDRENNYTVQIADGSAAKLTLLDLGLTASAGSTNLTDKQNLTVDVSANKNGRLVEATLLEDGDAVESQDTNLDSSGEATFDFGTQSEGTYTVEVTDVNTGITRTTDEVSVEEVTGSVSFAQKSISEQRGDVVEIPIDLSNADEAEVSFGSASVNFKANFTVTDSNDDGEATVLLNTSQTDDTNDPLTFVSVAGGDEVSTDSSQGLFVSDGEGGLEEASSSGISDPIASGSYEANLFLGGEEQDITQISINQRSTDGINTWVHPDANSYPEDVSDLLDSVSEDDNVAMNDLAVVQVEASGLYGYTSSVDDLHADGDANDQGLNVTFEQTEESTAPNSPANSFNASEAQAAYFDAENNTFFLLVDTAQTGMSSGDEYEVTFSVDSDKNSVTASDESVNTTFSVEERTIELTGQNDDDVLELAQGNATVSGETNVAPGSQVRVKVRSSDFLDTSTVEVNDNGTFSADFDFSNRDNGTEVDVTAELRNGGQSDKADGIILEDAGGEEPTETTDEAETETTTTEEDEETTTTEEETETETETTTTTETTTEEDNDGGIPGFGISVSLVALLAAALLALRRSN